MPSPRVILVRAGKLLLGVYFWLMIFILLIQFPLIALVVVSWLFPTWENGGWTFLYMPTQWYESLLQGLLWALTAAIGWAYVYPGKYKALWIFIALWGALWATGFPFTFPSASVPSDDELIANFQRHEAQFERLVAMFQEDSELYAVSSPSAARRYGSEGPLLVPENVVSPERTQEYLQLVEEVGVLNFGKAEDRQFGEMWMLPVAFEREIARTVIKGYVHSTHGRLPLVASLDDLPPMLQGPLFRRIRGDWYLYYMWSGPLMRQED